MSEWRKDELEMFCLETYGPRLWQSTICPCGVYLDFKCHRVFLNRFQRPTVKPCNYDHVIWCWRIGVPVVETLTEKWERAKPPQSYKAVLAEYLEWSKGNPLSFDEEIGSYKHGKAAREFAIKQYVEDYQRKLETGEHLFWGEELLVSTPMTHDTFQSIYHRDSQEDLVLHFYDEDRQARRVRRRVRRQR